MTPIRCDEDKHSTRTQHTANLAKNFLGVSQMFQHPTGDNQVKGSVGKGQPTTPSGDPEAMAESMLRLLTDDSLRNDVIKQGRHLVHANFNNIQLIKQLAAIYCRNIPALNCV